MAKRKAKRSVKKSVKSRAKKVSKKSSKPNKSSKKLAVKIYTTPTCPYCRMAKSFLKSKKIKYAEIDVTSDPKYVLELQTKSGQLGVPVIDIGGKIIIGFDEKAIRRTLKI